MFSTAYFVALTVVVAATLNYVVMVLRPDLKSNIFSKIKSRFKLSSETMRYMYWGVGACAAFVYLSALVQLVSSKDDQ